MAKFKNGFIEEIMIKLTAPFTEEKIRALKLGNEVLISGVVHTGRDAVHKYLHEGGQLPAGVSFKVTLRGCCSMSARIPGIKTTDFMIWSRRIT